MGSAPATYSVNGSVNGKDSTRDCIISVPRRDSRISVLLISQDIPRRGGPTVFLSVIKPLTELGSDIFELGPGRERHCQRQYYYHSSRYLLLEYSLPSSGSLPLS